MPPPFATPQDVPTRHSRTDQASVCLSTKTELLRRWLEIEKKKQEVLKRILLEITDKLARLA